MISFFETLYEDYLGWIILLGVVSVAAIFYYNKTQEINLDETVQKVYLADKQFGYNECKSFLYCKDEYYLILSDKIGEFERSKKLRNEYKTFERFFALTANPNRDMMWLESLKEDKGRDNTNEILNSVIIGQNVANTLSQKGTRR